MWTGASTTRSLRAATAGSRAARGMGAVLRTLTRGSTPPFTATLVVNTRRGSVSSVRP